MKYGNIKQIMDSIGVKEISVSPHGRWQSNTKIAINEGNYLTVSQLLSKVEYMVKFIEENFDVNKCQYSITISFLKTM